MNINRITMHYINQIINGDCLEVLKHLDSDSVDLIVTDPPYLAGFRDRDGRTLKNDGDGTWLAPAFAEIYRVLKSHRFMVSFYGWHKADLFFAAWRAAGFYPAAHLVWPKRYASAVRIVRYQHEQAYVLAKGNPARPYQPIPDVLPWNYTGNRLHPTQKPIEALLPLIKAFSRPGNTVLDPFCGSGTTCVAARMLGRQYIGIELDPTYAEVAQKRLSVKKEF
jgi:adenine-specific DNA-methyltransferase